MRQSQRILGRLLVLVMTAFGQQSSIARGDDGADDLENRRGIIRLDVVVSDSQGDPVRGLKPEDFSLLDNGEREEIVSVEAQGDAPVENIFVIDSLNLSAVQAATAKSELAKFLRKRDGHLAHPVMVYRLSSLGLTAIEGPSLDGNALAEDVIKDQERKTIWTVPPHPEGAPRPDAEQARNEGSLKGLGAVAIEERKRPGRKLLFWIGPGWPTEPAGQYSFKEITEFSTRLREARLSLCSVTAWAYPKREFTYEEYLKGVRGERDARPGDLSLEVLATKSGGVVTAPAFDLQATIDKSVQRANRFYTISFDPPKTDHADEYHDLKIVVNRRDASARTNSEYYNEPTYYDRPAIARRLTVAQFENNLLSRHGQPDAEMAEYLTGIELSERLDDEYLAKASSLMPGRRSRERLAAIAGQSAFFPPPAPEIGQSDPPDSTGQGAILQRLRQYLTEVIPSLPNLLATRATVHYAEPLPKDELDWKDRAANLSLRPFGTERTTVRVRNSQEVADRSTVGKDLVSRERNLVTEGAFGPILLMVARDIALPGGSVEWIRWEEVAGRHLAVFRFAVRDISRDFEVGFCCLADGDGTRAYKRKTAYHGEMAVDPKSGALLRIWIEADLPGRLPILRSAFAVDYGPVVMGGRTYLCPVKSVYISRARTVKMLDEWDERFGVYGPFQTLLNDVTFTNYHVFRSGHRILADVSPAP